MRSVQIRRRRTWFALGSFLTLMIFALAACGANTGSGTTSTGSSSATTPTTTVSAYGCPGAVMTTAPAPAKIVLKQSDSNATITAHVGDVVEIDLPFGEAGQADIESQR